MPQSRSEDARTNEQRKDKAEEKEALISQLPAGGTFIDAGLPNPVLVPSTIPENTRVTLKFASRDQPPNLQSADMTAQAVDPATPREEAGYYWGFAVRSAPSLSAVFTECPFEDGYDLSIGTSERGASLSSLSSSPTPERSSPEFRHALMVFGGVAGLEAAAKADRELVALGAEDPKDLFDHWVNLLPGQGSRTIRTEEAVWLGLMGARNTFLERGSK